MIALTVSDNMLWTCFACEKVLKKLKTNFWVLALRQGELMAEASRLLAAVLAVSGGNAILDGVSGGQ